MSIIKLPNVGDEATISVTECSRVEGNFGPQVRFVGANGDTLFLPADTAEQRIRFAFGVESSEECDIGMCVGTALRFFREPNKTKGAKPYWALEVVANAKPQPASARIPSPYREPGQRTATVVPGGELPEPPHGGLPPDWTDAPLAIPPELAEAEHGEGWEAAYLRLWSRVAEYQIAAGRRLDFPVDGQSVQAATATIWITLKDKGLLR